MTPCKLKYFGHVKHDSGLVVEDTFSIRRGTGDQSNDYHHPFEPKETHRAEVMTLQNKLITGRN